MNHCGNLHGKQFIFELWHHFGTNWTRFCISKSCKCYFNYTDYFYIIVEFWLLLLYWFFYHCFPYYVIFLCNASRFRNWVFIHIKMNIKKVVLIHFMCICSVINNLYIMHWGTGIYVYVTCYQQQSNCLAHGLYNA